MNPKLVTATMIIMVLFMSFKVEAQTEYSLSNTSKMKVDGLSTVSEWSAEIIEAKGNLVLIDTVKIEIGASLYTNLIFEFPVDKMESGRGPIMNSKIKTALKSTENPIVNYNSTENKIITVKDNIFELETKGTISVAGVEKPVSVILNGSFDEELKTISFEGNKDVTMSMFNIEKPTAFFGQLKTMDELNVKFNVSFTKQ